MKAILAFPRKKLLALVALWGVAVAVVPACSSRDHGPFWGGDAGSNAGVAAQDSGSPCEDGEHKVCGVTLSQGNGAMTCYRGTQFCQNGAWSTCQSGEVSREPLPYPSLDPAKRSVLGLPPISVPAACGLGVATGSGGAGTGGAASGGAATGGASGGAASGDFSNPCDPACMFFGENPIDINANGGADPGGMPSAPPRTCEHGMCTSGKGLVSSCDPCVASVCLAHPTCCNTASSTAWNSQCVDWAATICTGSPLPKTLCDFGLYSDEDVDLRNTGSADAVVGAYTNVTVQADSSNIRGIWALGNVTISSLNNAPFTVPDGIHANGSITFQSSPSSNITGNLYAGTTVNLEDVNVQNDVFSLAPSGTGIIGIAPVGSSVILGHAWARASISGNISVTNLHATNSSFTIPAVTLPTKTSGTAIPNLMSTITCPTTGPARTVPDGGLLAISPGTHGAVDVGYTNAALELNGQGTYIFQSLKIRDGSVLRLDLAGAPYSTGFDIRICDKSSVDGSPTQMFGSKVRVQGKAPITNDGNGTGGVMLDPKYLTIYYKGTAEVRFEPDSYFTGIFMAPNTRVTKADMNSGASAPLTLGPPTLAQITGGSRSAPINGAIWAKRVEVGVKSLTKGIPADSCRSMPLIQASIPLTSCPIVAGTTSLQNEPCVTGQDCQVNYSCEAPKTTGTCAPPPAGTGHDKCVVGTKLDANCGDDCVARICKAGALPGCCSGTWDASCVAAVGTYCDAVCRVGDCSQDPCKAQAAGTPIDKKCDDDLGSKAGCLDTVCAANPTCCSSGGTWTMTCVNALHTACDSKIAGVTRMCNYAVYASDEYIPSTPAPTINGGLVKTAAQVTDPDPTPPTVNFNCTAGTTSFSTPGTGLTLNAATHYNTVDLDYNQTLTFPAAGKYYFNDLRLEGNNTIALPAAPAVVEVIVCGKVYIGGGATFTGITTGADSLRFRVYSNYDGSGAIWFYRPSSGTQATYGALYAPYGGVRLGQNIVHNGFAWGEDVLLGPSAVVNYPAATETACGTIPLDDGAVCPLDLIPSPIVSGDCTANPLGYKDSSCVGYDLAAGIPCKDATGKKTIPICNHGTTDLTSTNVTIGYFDPSVAQLAVDEPLVAPIPPNGNTCNQTLTIPAGECRDLVCMGIPDSPTNTIMIDPLTPHGLSECGGGANGRRLDNWTVYDGRNCVPYSQPKRLEYEYEAKCPKGTSPRWGLLTWDTLTPALSSIAFSAKSGVDLDELTAGVYKPVGVAKATPNTQKCIFKSAPSCAVDLTATLALDPDNQGTFLDLQIDLTPNGGSPVLKDWGISYTCVYDE